MVSHYCEIRGSTADNHHETACGPIPHMNTWHIFFSVSDTTISNIVWTFIHVLHEVLFEGILSTNDIPSLEKNKAALPSSFSSFSSCRIILDCTEVQCEMRTNMEQQCLAWSNYKQRNTMKPLVGVATALTSFETDEPRRFSSG